MKRIISHPILRSVQHKNSIYFTPFFNRPSVNPLQRFSLFHLAWLLLPASAGLLPLNKLSATSHDLDTQWVAEARVEIIFRSAEPWVRWVAFPRMLMMTWSPMTMSGGSSRDTTSTRRWRSTPPGCPGQNVSLAVMGVGVGTLKHVPNYVDNICIIVIIGYLQEIGW